MRLSSLKLAADARHSNDGESRLLPGTHVGSFQLWA